MLNAITPEIVAWFLCGFFAMLYARSVAKCYRRRKEAEFWKRMTQYAGVGAGLGWLGLFNHRAANLDLAHEVAELKRRRNESFPDLQELNLLREENADLRKQLNLAEND